ncbi:MAG: methyl-accepting chemotaxis protein [Rubrivivax sp.]
MKLDQIKLGPRLGIGFGLVLALLTVVVAVAYQRLNAFEGELRHVLELERRSALAADWRHLTQLNAVRTIAIAKSGNHADVSATFEPQMKATSARITGVQGELEQVVDGQGRTLLSTISEQRKAYVGVRDEVFERLGAGDKAGALALLDGRMLPAADRYVASIEGLGDHQRHRVAEHSADSGAQVRHAEWLLLALLGASIMIAAGAGWMITRSITRPLRRAVAETETIAAGDLSAVIHADGCDEVGDLGRALARMQTALQGLVGAVQQSSESIGTASAQIASGNADLSSRTEQAASSLQQTASSMEQITGTVGQTADSARTADQLAASAASVAQRGGAVVAQVVATMDDINQSSRKIADIIGVIDSIAFQTNILALNAAVEAARAGEQGRGFAVVAGEVRSLAQRSAEAAREIKALIGSSVERVEAGSRLVADAGSTMNEIVTSVQRVSDIIGEISAAASEQRAGIGQVGSAVSELDRMTQQNAALVEQSAAAAQSLEEQAQRLVQAAASFRLAPRSSATLAPNPAGAAPRAVGSRRAAVSGSAPGAHRPPTAAASGAGDDWETF